MRLEWPRQGVIVQVFRKEFFRKKNDSSPTAVTRTFLRLPFRKVSESFVQTWNCVNASNETSPLAAVSALAVDGFDLRTFSLGNV